jgi:hypothetical protein
MVPDLAGGQAGRENYAIFSGSRALRAPQGYAQAGRCRSEPPDSSPEAGSLPPPGWRRCSPWRPVGKRPSISYLRTRAHRWAGRRARRWVGFRQPGAKGSGPGERTWTHAPAAVAWRRVVRSRISPLPTDKDPPCVPTARHRAWSAIPRAAGACHRVRRTWNARGCEATATLTDCASSASRIRTACTPTGRCAWGGGSARGAGTSRSTAWIPPNRGVSRGRSSVSSAGTLDGTVFPVNTAMQRPGSVSRRRTDHSGPRAFLVEELRFYWREPRYATIRRRELPTLLRVRCHLSGSRRRHLERS